jgi:hypothetical protein
MPAGQKRKKFQFSAINNAFRKKEEKKEEKNFSNCVKISDHLL